jgi:membrane protein DedA with SNARE-associated domain
MTGIIEQFGLLGVFALMVPESVCIPVPSEVTLLFSGFGVSQHWMTFWLAVLAATAGNLVGSLIAYGIGATRLVEQVPGAGALLRRWDQTFDERGLRAVFVARLLPLARTFVSLPAGARGVPLGPFVVLTTIGCGLWAAGFIVIGMVSGTAWASVSSVLGKVLLGVGLACLAWLAYRATHRGDASD